MPNTLKFREEWLQQLVELLRPFFKEQTGKEIPAKIHVSCGWPSTRAMSTKKRARGQCFPKRMSKGEFNEIFVSPILTDPVEVGRTVVHELVHAVDDCLNGHKGPFIDLAKAAGLVRPWTSSTLGDGLKSTLEGMTAQIGPYPHACLDKTAFDEIMKKQSTRLIKVVCPGAECGVVIRMTRKYISDGLLPTCACGEKMQEAA